MIDKASKVENNTEGTREQIKRETHKGRGARERKRGKEGERIKHETG